MVSPATQGRHRWRKRILAGLVSVAIVGTFLIVVGVTSSAANTFTSAQINSSTKSTLPVQRIYGTDAIGTSIAVSQAEFPTAGSARAVVLARSDFFSDALAGGPLAAKMGGPLLITPGASLSPSLDSRVQGEIERVLPAGDTVYILGGNLALSPNIDSALQGLGYVTQRVAGADEYATAVDVAEQLSNPSTIFEATGLDFPDALSAVPVAIARDGAILLTDGSIQAPETASYLAAHPSDTRYAIGGPLAAYSADPTATPVYGQDLYGTSAAVASTFFASATVFGAATGVNFPDALSGGVFMGTRATEGPMLLVQPSGPLSASVASYLSDAASTLTQGYLFGGPLAVGDDVLLELETPRSTPALAVVTSGLPSGTVGASYSATLSASGGTPPYTWAITAGSLPSGLSLSSSGAITGTPSTTGSSSFTVQVTDSTTPTAQTATKALSISVSAPPVQTVTSDNWSGYAVTGGPFTYVTGTFTVPYLQTYVPNSAAVEWVGIDGVSNSSLIQAGVDELPYNSSYFILQPWWEILPALQTSITTVTVHAGDTVTVTIGEVSGTEWGITLTDDTNGESFTTDQTYTGPGSSAEWIVEAPIANGSLITLALYSPVVTFSDLWITGAQTTLTKSIMVQNGVQVSTPSALDSNGFNVAYGDVAPAAP
jgi:nucleoid-associated protein YgaU